MTGNDLIGQTVFISIKEFNYYPLECTLIDYLGDEAQIMTKSGVEFSINFKELIMNKQLVPYNDSKALNLPSQQICRRGKLSVNGIPHNSEEKPPRLFSERGAPMPVGNDRDWHSVADGSLS